MERASERGHILCLPWRVCKVVKIMCKMSLNPLKHRFLFFCPLFPLLLLCPAYSAAAAVRFLLDYFDCVIVLKLWYNIYSLFHSLSISLRLSLLLSVLRRFSLNCFRCLRYLAPLFRLFCPPVIHLFLFWLFFPRFLPFFCARL